MQTHNYEKLLVWQRAMILVTDIYALTGDFPKTEVYGLVSQMRRCAVSIPSNIAEGSRRKSKKDFARMLVLAFGSGAELETQIKIAKNLGFGSMKECEMAERSLGEVMKMLNKLIENNE